MTRRIFYFDLFERMAWTFAQGFAAFWIVTGDVDADTIKAGLIAGGISVAKSVVATQVGDRNSAATLPSPPDGTRPDRPLRADRGQSLLNAAVTVLVVVLVVFAVVHLARTI